MYKEGRAVMDDLDSKLAWLRQALEYQNDTDNAKDFVDSVRKDFFSDYVFVLTPRGDIIDLPAGSTPLDFAYRIHTNLGHHTQHAKVNGTMARLDYKLKTNDVVEIVTSASQVGPSRDWIKIVKTQQAKAKIRQWFKKANREENIKNGKDMLEEAARRHGYHISDLVKPEYFGELLKRHNMGSLDDLYAAIGYGGISTGQTLHKLVELHRKATKAAQMADEITGKEEQIQKPESQGGGRGVIVSGEPNMVIRFAHCCSPLPGDRIIGYITRGRGVSVHRKDCPNIKELLIDSERIIKVEWAADVKSSYTANIQLTATERSGILMDISQLLVNMNISLIAVNAKTDKNNQVTVQLSFEVKDTAQMDTVIKNLRKIRSVNEVYRLSV
jgi:GTP pyrophosphokinase